MAQGQNPNDLEFLGEVISSKLNNQPKTKKVANTITTVVGAIVSMAAVALSLPLNLPDWAYFVIVAITTLGTALGVRTTKNGFSDSQIAKLEKWKAEYIDEVHERTAHANPVMINPHTDELEAAPTEREPRHLFEELADNFRAGDLNKMVDQFIQRR